MLLGATLVIFLLLHTIPGNPLRNFSAAQRAMDNYAFNDAVLREVNRRFGLDLPLWHQFTRYVIGDKIDGEFVCGVICGNLGPSTSQKGRSVESILFSAPVGKTFWESQFGYSIRLGVYGFHDCYPFWSPFGVSRSQESPYIYRSFSIVHPGSIYLNSKFCIRAFSHNCVCQVVAPDKRST